MLEQSNATGESRRPFQPVARVISCPPAEQLGKELLVSKSPLEMVCEKALALRAKPRINKFPFNLNVLIMISGFKVN